MLRQATVALLTSALIFQSAQPAMAAVGRAAVGPARTAVARVSFIPGRLTSVTPRLGSVKVSLTGVLNGVSPVPSVIATPAPQGPGVISAAVPVLGNTAESVLGRLATPEAKKLGANKTALPTLRAAEEGMGEMKKKPGSGSLDIGISAGNRIYDGSLVDESGVGAVFGDYDGGSASKSGLSRKDSTPQLDPSFAPPRADASLPLEEIEDAEPYEQEDGLRLGFPQAMKNIVTAGNPAKIISGAMKLVRPYKGSKRYWADFRKGKPLTITIGGEKIFETKITRAVNKPIKKLTRKDFQKMMPDYKLTAGVRELRGALIDSLESRRRMWQPSDPPISLNSTVRVIEFRSFREVYQDKHGKDAKPEKPAPTERTPLKIKPTGALARLQYLMPRAVFVDLDMFEGPVSREILLDMAKMQRSGTYFVGLSRKPYEAAEGLRDNFIRQMSDYQLGRLSTYRLLVVSDDGAVISSFPKDGNMNPIKVAEITSNEIAVLEDAVRRASAEAGISARSVRRIEQPSIYTLEDSANKFSRKRYGQPNTQVRFEVEFTRAVTAGQRAAWQKAYDKLLKAHGLELMQKEFTAENGRARLSWQKTDLAGAMPALQQALQDEFQLYLNPGDYLVLSDDKEVLAANKGVLDVHGLSGLEGEELVENALGLVLGEYRQDLDIDRVGSASRMISFTKYRERYMADMVVDEQRSEQNINFFSGHMVHSSNDWLVWHLRNGRRPTADEYEAHMRGLWAKGLTGAKPVGIPDADKMKGWLDSSVRRALKMREIIFKIHDRGEIIIGSEIPRQLIVKDYNRKKGHEGELKGRFITNAIIDLLVYRPNPDKPGHGTIVVYDYKSGPAKSREKLEEDPQVLIYALLAQENWVGKTIPLPYLNGTDEVTIDDYAVEFIYSPLKQNANINRWMLEAIRLKIINVYERIYRATAELMGEVAPKKRTRRLEGDPKRTLPATVPGLRLGAEDSARLMAGKAKSFVRKASAQPKPYVAIIDNDGKVLGFARIYRVTPLENGSFRWYFSNVTPVRSPYAGPSKRGGSWVKDVPVKGARILKAGPVKKTKRK